jgi:hypothetical protein
VRQPQPPPHWQEPPDWQPQEQPEPQPQFIAMTMGSGDAVMGLLLEGVLV